MNLPKYYSRLSLRWKILLPFLGLSLLVSFAGTYVLGRSLEGQIYDQASEEVRHEARLAAFHLEREQARRHGHHRRRAAQGRALRAAPGHHPVAGDALQVGHRPPGERPPPPAAPARPRRHLDRTIGPCRCDHEGGLRPALFRARAARTLWLSTSLQRRRTEPEAQTTVVRTPPASTAGAETMSTRPTQAAANDASRNGTLTRVSTAP